MHQLVLLSRYSYLTFMFMLLLLQGCSMNDFDVISAEWIPEASYIEDGSQNTITSATRRPGFLILTVKINIKENPPQQAPWLESSAFVVSKDNGHTFKSEGVKIIECSGLMIQVDGDYTLCGGRKDRSDGKFYPHFRFSMLAGQSMTLAFLYRIEDGSIDDWYDVSCSDSNAKISKKRIKAQSGSQTVENTPRQRSGVTRNEFSSPLPPGILPPVSPR